MMRRRRTAVDDGEAVVQVAKAIDDLANGGTPPNPVDVFRSGLGES
jgi:hypothetical protein